MSISKSEFARRRKNLMALMEPNSIAIFHSAREQVRSRDTEYPFRQDSDFYYLSGFTEPDAVLVLVPGRRHGQFVMFCRERDPAMELWHGFRAGPEGVCEKHAADDAFPIGDIDDILPGLIEGRERVYYSMGRSARFDRQIMAWVNSIRSKEASGAVPPGEFTDLDHLLPRILEISREVFNFENAIIRLLSEDGKMLQSVASFGYSETVVANPIALGQGVTGKAAKFGKPYLIQNLSQTDDYIPGIAEARSELAVPLIARDRVIGVFNVESEQLEAFSEADCDALSILAGQAAIAIDNAHLYRDLCRVSREKDDLNHLNGKILSSISIGLYTIDRHMQITSWNDSMVKMSGIAAQRAIGSSLLELFPSLEEEGVADRLRRVLSSGKPEKLRLLHRGIAGENRLQKRFMAPLKTKTKTIGAVVVVEDITDFEQLMAQTIQSEKLAEVGRMSAGIAHEINNPLAVISYACQLLEAGEESAEEQLELLHRVGNEVDRLKILTTELLSYSGNQDYNKKLTDLNMTVQESGSLLRYELNKEQVTLTEDLGELPVVNVDNNKFKQIFINLILNAVPQAIEMSKANFLGKIIICTGSKCLNC